MHASTLTRKTFRDLKAQLPRVSALALILAVGTLSFVVMRSAHHDLRQAQANFYRRCRFAHFWIDLKRAAISDLQWLHKEPLRAVEFRIVQHVRVLEPESAGPVSAIALSAPTSRRSLVNDFVLLQGSYFDRASSNEVIVNSAFARAHQLEPGDTVVIILGGKRVRLRVRGIATAAELVYLLPPGSVVPDPERYGLLYLPEPFMRAVTGYRGAANQVTGLFATNKYAEQIELLRYFERRLEPWGVLRAYLRQNQTSHRYLSDEIHGLRTFSVVLSSFFFVVTILILNILMVRHIESQRQIVGLLKALGYSNARVAGHYLSQAAVVGATGAILGSVAAEAIHGPLIQMYRRFFEFPRLEAHIYPLEHLLSLGLGLATSSLGALRAVRLALALPPAQAMRPVTPSAPRRVPLLRLIRPRPVRSAIRYLVRHPVRLTAGASAAAFAAALFLTALIADQAVRYMLHHQYRLVERHKWAIQLRDSRHADSARDLAEILGNVPAEGMAVLPVEVRHGPKQRRTALLGLPRPHVLFVPRDRHERTVPVPAGGLTMSRKLADLLDVRRGELVTVRALVGDRRSDRLPVLHVVDDYFGLACYASRRTVARLTGHSDLVDTVLVRLDPTVDRAAALAPLRNYANIQAIRDRDRDRQSLEELVIELNAFFIGLLVVFAAVLLIGSLYNIVFLSLTERRREFATMLALGFSAAEVAAMFLWELLLVCVVGLALGLPLGYGLAVLLSIFYDTEYFRMPVVAPPLVWIGTVVLTLGAAFVSFAVAVLALVRSRWQEWLKVFE